MAPPVKSSDPPIAPPASNGETDLIRSLPGPVIRVLVLFARPIRFIRISAEVLLWKNGRRVESWMVVGGWWAICLGAGHGFKYLLPAAVFLPLLPLDILLLPHIGTLPGLRNKPLPPSTAAEPSTHDSLLMTLSDLHSVHALIPAISSSRVAETYDRFRHLGPARLSRGLVVIWCTWLVLGRVVGYRALLALLGTVLLLLPSPPFAQLVDLLSHSLLVRRSLALLFLLTFGSPPEQSIKFSFQFSLKEWVHGKWAASRRPSLAFAIRPKMTAGDSKEQVIEEDEEEEKGDPIYFKFEVHENQRWWMGLDWTSALVPQERPSWCDSHLLPASPPGAFTLPSPTSIVLPAPTVSDPDAKIRRTAIWKWLDDDWCIVRAGAGARAASTNPLASAPVSGITSPNPSGDDTSASTSDSPSTSSIQRMASPAKARPASGIFGTSPDDSTSTGSITSPSTSAARAQSIAEQAFTKGLERLKRSAAPVVAGVVSSPRNSSEYTRPGASAAGGTGTGASAGANGGGGGVDRRTSQASDDLAAIEERIAASAASNGVGLGIHTGGAATALMGGGEMIVERDEATDVDGWVYGDNKWESMGPKGGLGKFTRRRRWTRRAMCIETIQRIPSIIEPPTPAPASAPGASASSTSNSTATPSSNTSTAGSIASAISSLATGYKVPTSTSTTAELQTTPQKPPLKRQSSSTSPAITPKASSQPPLPVPLPAVQTDMSAMALPGLHAASPTRGRSMTGAIERERERERSGSSLSRHGSGEGSIGTVGIGAGVGAGAESVIPSAARNESRDDVLRQRLKKAMGSMGG